MSQKYFIDDVNIEKNKKLCHFKLFPAIWACETHVFVLTKPIIPAIHNQGFKKIKMIRDHNDDKKIKISTNLAESVLLHLWVT